jgi:hypothetical protein
MPLLISGQIPKSTEQKANDHDCSLTDVYTFISEAIGMILSLFSVDLVICKLPIVSYKKSMSGDHLAQSPLTVTTSKLAFSSSSRALLEH